MECIILYLLRCFMLPCNLALALSVPQIQFVSGFARAPPRYVEDLCELSYRPDKKLCSNLWQLIQNVHACFTTSPFKTMRMCIDLSWGLIFFFLPFLAYCPGFQPCWVGSIELWIFKGQYCPLTIGWPLYQMWSPRSVSSSVFYKYMCSLWKSTYANAQFLSYFLQARSMEL